MIPSKKKERVCARVCAGKKKEDPAGDLFFKTSQMGSAVRRDSSIFKQSDAFFFNIL